MSRNRHPDAILPLTAGLSLSPMRLSIAMTVTVTGAFLGGALPGPALVRAAEDPITAVRTGMEQWVKTRQLISRTQSDWEAEREMMAQSKALLERELASIADQRSQVTTNFTQVERERVAAERELSEANETLERARNSVAQMESSIRSLLELLPEPLVESLEPLRHKLPSDPESTRSTATVTERVQTVVSILNEIDKFGNAVGVFSEKRANERGEQVAVETVYLGLGAAYFVNQTGDFAGIGSPGPKGWEWKPDPALAEPVREVIRIYRSERPARFVALPVTLQ